MAEKPENEGRRNVLGILAGGTLACAAGAFAVVGGRFLYPVGKRKPAPLFVCLESEVPREKSLEIRDPAGRKVFLMRRPDGELITMGTVCTHLGCAVFYRPEQRIFECPCHQGVFDGDGNPVAGPPRRRLDRYPTEVREGKVFVQFA